MRRQLFKIKLIPAITLLTTAIILLSSCSVIDELLNSLNETSGPSAEIRVEQFDVEVTNDTVQNADLVTLDGTLSSAGDGGTFGDSIVSYEWTLLGSPFLSTAELTSATSSYAYFIPDVVGSYNISLKVSSQGESNTTTITLESVLSTAPPVPPVADASFATHIGVQDINGDATIIFNGSNSTDSDGSIISYNWDYGDFGSGTGVVTNHTYSPGIIFSDETYNASLTVTDDQGESDTTNFVVTIQPYANQPPIADAGGDQSVFEGNTVFFDGSNSTDPENDTLSYAWDFDNDLITDSVSINPSYIFPTAGTYIVSLTVEDVIPNSNTDTITITVNPPPAVPPIAVAGLDQNVYINDIVSYDGSGSTDDVGIVLYEWDLDFDGTYESFGVTQTQSFTVPGSYKSRLRVTDTDALTSTDTIIVNVSLPPLFNLLLLSAAGAMNDIIGPLSALPDLGSFDIRLDGDIVNITLTELMNYDIVIVAAWSDWNDNMNTSEVLAQYVDNGGRVILLGATIFGRGLGLWSLDGRIMDVGYSPVDSVDYVGALTTADSFIIHPMTANTTMFTSNVASTVSTTQGTGVANGHYTGNLQIASAYNSILPIAVINVMPFDGYWTGDFPKLLGDTVFYLLNTPRYY